MVRRQGLGSGPEARPHKAKAKPTEGEAEPGVDRCGSRAGGSGWEEPRARRRTGGEAARPRRRERVGRAKGGKRTGGEAARPSRRERVGRAKGGKRTGGEAARPSRRERVGRKWSLVNCLAAVCGSPGSRVRARA